MATLEADEVVIYSKLIDKNKIIVFRTRYGDIKNKTNINRDALNPVINSALEHLNSCGLTEIAAEPATNNPSWESSINVPYLPYNPYITGFSSSYSSETFEKFWKSVFNTNVSAPITRPISGWPITGSNLCGVPKGNRISILNRFRPPCKCTKIQITGIYWNVVSPAATVPANVANNGESFFVVPQNAIVKEKWQLYRERSVYGRNNTVLRELIAEWCTFDEMCSVAHNVEYGTYSAAVTTAGAMAGLPTVFIGLTGGTDYNISQTKFIKWTWKFDDQIFMKNIDSLHIVVGETLSTTQSIGNTNLKNLTAMAYFEKIETGLDTYTTNSVNGAIIVL